MRFMFPILVVIYNVGTVVANEPVANLPPPIDSKATPVAKLAPQGYHVECIGGTCYYVPDPTPAPVVTNIPVGAIPVATPDCPCVQQNGVCNCPTTNRVPVSSVSSDFFVTGRRVLFPRIHRLFLGS